jgi:hypothetical protein
MIKKNVIFGLVAVTVFLSAAIWLLADDKKQTDPPVIMKLTIKMPAEPFMAGGSMPISLELENVGNAAVVVPDPERQSPFQYIVSDGAGNTVTSFSAAMQEALLQGGSVPPDRGGPSLEPAKSTTYVDDMGRHLIQPLLPGDYSLKAGVATSTGYVESESVPLKLTSPRVIQLAHAADRDRRKVHSVMMAHDASGSAALFGRVSPRNHPELGIFRKFKEPTVSSNAKSLCLAQEARLSPNWRWAVWIDKDRLGGAMTREYDARYAFSDYDPALTAAEVIVGYQDDKGLATFVLVGSQGERRTVKLFRIIGAKQFELVDCKLDLPASGGIQISGAYHGSALQLKLFWLADATRIVSATLDGVNGTLAQPPSDFCKPSLPILAFRVPELRSEQANRGLLLLDRDGNREESTPKSAYLNLDSGGVSEEGSRPEVKPGVEQWILPAHEAPGFPLLARMNGQFSISRIGKTNGWEPLPWIPGTATSLKVLVLENGAVWATYFVPESGVVFRSLD